MIKLSNVNKGKEIERGMQGAIYLATKNKKKYVIKIGKILKSDIKEDFKYSFWREIEFATTMNKLHPDHFMKLYDYEIQENCDHKQSLQGFGIKFKDLPKGLQNYYKKLWSSKYCAVRLYSYVDSTLNTLLNSWKDFKPDIFYDLFIQVIYVVYLMDKQGYFHNDFHPKNIGINHTNKKFINILGHRITTHSYLVVALDYDLVLHNKYGLHPLEHKYFINNNDIFTLLVTLIVQFTPFIHHYKNELKKIDIYEMDLKLKIDDDDKQLLLPLLCNDELTNENKNYLLKLLFKVVFYEKYEKYLLGDKLSKVIYPDFVLTTNVILFMIKNIYDIKKILLYLINNRNT